MRGPLIDSLLDTWPQIDRIITNTNANMIEALIWRTIDADDTAKIADSLLGLGQRHVGVASMIRGTTLAHETYGAGSIIFMRTVQSVLHYVRNGGMTLPRYGQFVKRSTSEGT